MSFLTPFIPRRGRRRVVIGLWAVLVAGCATSGEQARTPRQASLMVSNRTDYEWQVKATPLAGGERVVTLIGRRQIVEMRLACGEYQIEQTALIGASATSLTRNQRLTLEAGETYDWALMTLLSAP